MASDTKQYDPTPVKIVDGPGKYDIQLGLMENSREHPRYVVITLGAENDHDWWLEGCQIRGEVEAVAHYMNRQFVAGCDSWRIEIRTRSGMVVVRNYDLLTRKGQVEIETPPIDVVSIVFEKFEPMIVHKCGEPRNLKKFYSVARREMMRLRRANLRGSPERDPVALWFDNY